MRWVGNCVCRAFRGLKVQDTYFYALITQVKQALATMESQIARVFLVDISLRCGGSGRRLH